MSDHPSLEVTRQAIIDVLVKNGVIGAREAVDRLIDASLHEVEEILDTCYDGADLHNRLVDLFEQRKKR